MIVLPYCQWETNRMNKLYNNSGTYDKILRKISYKTFNKYMYFLFIFKHFLYIFYGCCIFLKEQCWKFKLTIVLKIQESVVTLWTVIVFNIYSPKHKWVLESHSNWQLESENLRQFPAILVIPTQTYTHKRFTFFSKRLPARLSVGSFV